MNTLLIAGSRDITDDDEVYDILNYASYILGKHVTTIIHGGARGVDTEGAHWGTDKGYDVVEYTAQWDKLGKRAGYVRNGEMVRDADSAIIVWDGQSRGTYNTVQLVKEKGIPFVLVRL